MEFGRFMLRATLALIAILLVTTYGRYAIYAYMAVLAWGIVSKHF